MIKDELTQKINMAPGYEITDRDRAVKGVQNRLAGDRVTPTRIDPFNRPAITRVSDYIEFEPILTPKNPDTDNIRLYNKTTGSDTKLFVLQDDGTELELLSSASLGDLDSAYNNGSTIAVDTTDVDWQLTNNKTFKVTDGTDDYFSISPTGNINLAQLEVNIENGLTIGNELTVGQNLVVNSSAEIYGNTVVEDSVIYSQESVHSSASTQTKSANYTMTEADSGLITYIDTDAITITLPATVTGYTYTFVNAGNDGAVAVNISPNANDKIMGNGFTSLDNKDAINTKATAKRGDLLQIVGDGNNGWCIQRVHGTWAREA